jgi:hypothetical protein
MYVQNVKKQRDALLEDSETRCGSPPLHIVLKWKKGTMKELSEIEIVIFQWHN